MKSKGKAVRSFSLEARLKGLTSQADKSRLRKAKADARAGAVSNIALVEGGISSTVRASGPERGRFQVFIPFFEDQTNQIETVSMWLARRPDWLAAHFCGIWESDFAKFLDNSEMGVFPSDPEEKLADWEMTCTCSDLQPPCSHMLAALLHLIWDAEQHPLAVFRFVGMDTEGLIDCAHRLGVTLMQSVKGTELESMKLEHAAGEIVENTNISDLLYGVEISEPIGRLIPKLKESTTRSLP